MAAYSHKDIFNRKLALIERDNSRMGQHYLAVQERQERREQTMAGA